MKIRIQKHLYKINIKLYEPLFTVDENQNSKTFIQDKHKTI